MCLLFVGRSAVSEECNGNYPQSTVNLHRFLGEQFVHL